MKIGIIVTESGTHSAEKLALVCASNLVGISNITQNDPRYVAATRLQLDVADALTKHHDGVQRSIQAALEADAPAHFSSSDLHAPGERLDAAIADVLAVTDLTEWSHVFRDEVGMNAMSACIGQSLVDTAHLERLYHGDRNPSDQYAAAYRENPSGVLIIPVSL